MRTCCVTVHLPAHGEAWRKAVTFWAVNGIIIQTLGNLIKDLLSDDDEDEQWKLADYARAIAMGPLTGAVTFGPMIDAVTSLFGGFERKQAAPMITSAVGIGKEFIEALRDDEPFDWTDQERILRGIGGLLGGRWSALNVTKNLGRQLVGLADNLVTTPQEAMEADAGKQRRAEKEAREAREAALSAGEREALRQERERRKQERLEPDAAAWGAGP